MNLKTLAEKPERLTGGHRACAGCSAPVVARQVLMAAEHPVVVGCATSCLEVVTTIFPFTAWKVPYIHCAFENVAATISGVETAYRALRKRGELDRDIRFVAFGGDGGTYDIGLQSLSGALERGHRFLYICYDNEGYMNTGIQRSGATPRGAQTTTSPAGKTTPGKTERRKNLTDCVIAHHIPYVAQAVPTLWKDFMTKVQRGLDAPGPAFINVLSPCTLGWGFDPSLTMEIARLAVETCFWPLYEVVDGRYRLTYRPKEKRPFREWMEKQERFRHLFTDANQPLLDQLQAEVDQEWEGLLRQCEDSKEVVE
ncbi:MAG: pyruvate ferredoxin oxidoreductase [Candidatus Latescibacteria bacterium]|nr:pyruvate ferredoxin oxidoreductase [Candidatus Latescibacterota bacterium]